MNHATLRAFEVPLLRSLGLEVFTSKRLPYTQYQNSSVDYSYDESLTIPPKVLDALNQHNYYEEQLPPHIADHLNTYFGTVICPFFKRLATEILHSYEKRIVLRVFGAQDPHTYTEGLAEFGGQKLLSRIQEVSGRFWFAPAYEGIAETECPLLRDRAVVLPLGLPDSILGTQDTWVGNDKRIMFVCPRIEDHTDYYTRIYESFKKHFGDLPHLIGGWQSFHMSDRTVTGWVPEEQYRKWFRELRVMFYHSREPRHLHYHPLEAIACGMPVIFMRGGLLERLGGADQPGACSSFREARRKLRRTLDGDMDFASECVNAQKKILEGFTPKHTEAQWRENFVGPVLGTPLKDHVLIVSAQVRERARPSVAVFLPKPYRGGTLQVTKRLAKVLRLGARKKSIDLKVILSCPADGYSFDSEFEDVKRLGIAVRPTTWRVVSQEDSASIIATQGLDAKKGAEYVLPGDGCNDFLDCGFWLIVSDRVNRPILPVRPYGVYELDFIQRYVPEAFDDTSYKIQREAIPSLLRSAKCVITTTPATERDVSYYAGVPTRRVLRCPLLIEPPPERIRDRFLAEDYFVWPTNITEHKNHRRVLAALRKYYEHQDGELRTLIIGPTSKAFHTEEREPERDKDTYSQDIGRLIAETQALSENVVIAGELPDAGYASAIAHARFLLSPNLYDNGSFATIDAAFLGVPTLAGRYPAQEYIAETCRLGCKWFDPYSVDDLARALKEMESDAENMELPQRDFLETFTWENRSEEIFEIIYPYIRRCTINALR